MDWSQGGRINVFDREYVRVHNTQKTEPAILAKFLRKAPPCLLLHSGLMRGKSGVLMR